jgi:hypothetical protein
MLEKRILMLAVVAALAACDGPTDRQPVADVDGATALPPPAAIRTQVAVFELVQAGTPRAQEAEAPCSIDKINGQPTSGTVLAGPGGELLAGGWVASPDMRAPERLMLVLEGNQTYQAPATTGVARPDLVRVLKAEGLANAGFNARAGLQGVAPGEYGLSLAHEFKGTTVRCRTAAKVTVRQA